MGAVGDHGDLVSRAIKAAQCGDSEGIHFLYVRYSSEVQRYIRSFVHDRHEAEDISQNVFAKLMTSIQRYEPRQVPFTAWLMRVARNAALDYLRSRRATPYEEVYVQDHGPSRIREGGGNALLDALDQLPTEQREVLILRHIVGLSPTEIASALGKTESSVHGLHHRGRIVLQAALRDAGASPVVMAD